MNEINQALQIIWEAYLEYLETNEECICVQH